MNLSFSTRGWNTLSWEEQVRDAVDMGFQGIEPYNIQEFPTLSGRGGAFHAYSQNETLRDLKKNKLILPCFDTSVDLSLPLQSEEKVQYLIQTASSMKVRYVAFCALQDNEDQIRSNLEIILPLARSEGICVLHRTRQSVISADMSNMFICAIPMMTGLIISLVKALCRSVI